MPTPSDPIAIQPKTYDEMTNAAQAALDEAARAVEEQKARFEEYQQAVNPHEGVPPVSGDCILYGK